MTVQWTGQRPPAEDVKIRTSSNFELCYIRHQYFRKGQRNPGAKELDPYNKIIKNLCARTFGRHRSLFQTVGFEFGDLVSISQVHLVSFLNLFALEKLPHKLKTFAKDFEKFNDRPMEPEDLIDKNRANFTLFLKQRMEDLARICRQKARNIKGFAVEEYAVFYGPTQPPKILRNLLDSHEKFGFRKIDISVFKSIRKKAIGKQQKLAFKFNGTWYVCVPTEQKFLSLSDFTGAGLDPYDSIHNMNPEQIFFSAQEEERWKRNQKDFNEWPIERKREIIQSFIEENEGIGAYKEELNTAKKLLKEMEIL